MHNYYKKKKKKGGEPNGAVLNGTVHCLLPPERYSGEEKKKKTLYFLFFFCRSPLPTDRDPTPVGHQQKQWPTTRLVAEAEGGPPLPDSRSSTRSWVHDEKPHPWFYK